MPRACHICVHAGAGTGKTFTIRNGVRSSLGQPVEAPGTDEQIAVWNSLQLDSQPEPIHLASFSKASAEQLKLGCPKEVTASSTYSMGLAQAFRNGLASGNKGNGDPDKKYEWILCDILNSSRGQFEKDNPGLFHASLELCSKARLALKKTVTAKDMADLAEWYGIDVEYDDEYVAEIVNEMLGKGREKTQQFDYVDMVYLPNVLGIIKRKYNTLYVDEAQDMGIAQQELCMKLAWRVVLVGDKHQAIYGFLGADSDALGRMIGWLDMTAQSCQSFPLTLTRRCAKAIVAEANAGVGELRPLPDAIDGKVVKMDCGSFDLNQVDLDWMIICPTNAPMVSMLFKLQKLGKKGFVRSQKMAEKMKGLLGYDSKGMEDIRKSVQKKMESAQNGRPGRAQKAKLDMLRCLLEIAFECTSRTAILTTIDNMFPEVEPMFHIPLSSIHQAKGREEDKVLFWEYDRCLANCDKAWEKQQAANLLYVGETRARFELHKARSGR